MTKGRDMTYPKITPRGQHRPYIGNARAWLDESVISPRTECVTATFPENTPATADHICETRTSVLSHQRRLTSRSGQQYADQCS